MAETDSNNNGTTGTTGNGGTNASFTDRASRAAHEAVDRLAGQGAQYEERLRSGSQQASERGHELADQVGDYVKKNPMQSVGIAVAAGFLLGSILRR